MGAVWWHCGGYPEGVFLSHSVPSGVAKQDPYGPGKYYESTTHVERSCGYGPIWTGLTRQGGPVALENAGLLRRLETRRGPKMRHVAAFRSRRR
jgi:hypothetical protein